MAGHTLIVLKRFNDNNNKKKTMNVVHVYVMFLSLFLTVTSVAADQLGECHYA